MQIQLSIQLQEQMKDMILQYIEALDHAGIIKIVKENYLSNKCQIEYDLYLINNLFTMSKNNNLKIFKEIENNYFVNLEDKNELIEYYKKYDLAKYNKNYNKWSKERREIINDFYYNNEFIYMSAYIFVKINKSFIIKQIEKVNSNENNCLINN